MTIIRDDDTIDTSARIRDTGGERTEDSVRRIAAAITGALEGFVEALDRYEVANEGKEALHNAGEISRAAAVEGKAVAQTPEMREFGQHMSTAGHKVADVGSSAYGATTDKMHAGADAVRQRTNDLKASVREQAESVKYAAQRTKEEVKVRAEAVAETGRRARVAPRNIMHEYGEAFGAWKRALMTSIAMFALIAVVGIAAFVVLTIALIAGLTVLIGPIAALFVVALLYVVVAGICYAVAKSARTRAAHEREEHMENVREEMRHVGRPVRNAFSRGRAGI